MRLSERNIEFHYDKKMFDSTAMSAVLPPGKQLGITRQFRRVGCIRNHVWNGLVRSAS